MNTKEFEEKINEYFEYVKAIYINEFSKYMDKQLKNEIQNMDCNVELRDELPYKVHVHDNRITFNLDLKRFIDENNLKDEKSLTDLSDDCKSYVKYLVDNQDDVFEVIKNKLLESFILLFTKNRKDVVTLGTAKIISKNLAKKYNLPNEDILNIKEEQAAVYIRDIVGNDILLHGIISRDHDIIAKTFDSYSNTQDYKSFTKELNKIYDKYEKNSVKVFLPDSLYEYGRIDYKLDAELKNIKEEKMYDKKNKLLRLTSIKRSIDNMISHKFLYSALEQRKLEDAYNEITNVLNNISISIKRNDVEGRKTSIELIDKEYDNMLVIEKNIEKLITPIWNNYLTNIKNKTGEFNYLVSTMIDEDVIEAKVVTSDMFGKIPCINLKYGFICYPKDNGIIYASTKPLKYEKVSNDFIFHNESESPLQTPNMLAKSNLKNKKLSNEVLLDRNKTYIKGVYCYADEDLENCPNYLKACVLSEDNDLPLIILNQEDLIKSTVKVA